MKLKSARVREFRSIRDSNEIEFGPITCMVGKNESGKTSILQALYRLNPVVPGEGKFDVTDDYPRMDVEDYQQDVQKGKRTPAIVVRAVFILEDADLVKIQQDFGKCVKGNEMVLSKGYENKLFVEYEIDEARGVKGFIGAKLPSLAAVPECATFAELLTYLATQQETPEITAAKTALNEIKKRGFLLYVFDKYLHALVPKLFYFDEFYQMEGQVNIEGLRDRNNSPKKEALLKSDHPMLGLIELARLSMDELLNPERTEWLINKLEGAGNHLTKLAMKYWSQNRHLQMRFDVRPARSGDPENMRSGTNLWARVFDLKHHVSTPLGQRSRGFVWFFSFLAWFSKLQQGSDPLILLLDEPGLFLHAKAQGDLLQFIEAELKAHQVVYSTHSPFMVDAHHFERVRIVEDKTMETDAPLPKDQEGTKVSTDVLDVGTGTLFPLQGALGYEISQTLFVGANSLVVEGVSDLLYIETVSGLLDAAGREGKRKEWTITPVGGADKVPTFIALLGAQKDLKIATVLDLQKKDEQTIENLYKKKLLAKNRVLTFAQFAGTAEADIEDMFPPQFYLDLINAEFKPELTSPIKEADLKSKNPRVLVRLNEYFTAHPLKGGKAFSHYRPARHFAENIGTLKTNIPASTLDRFEALFKALNALL